MSAAKTFDAVATMRAIRARREEEFAGRSWGARLRVIRERVASDPLWRRLAAAPANTPTDPPAEPDDRIPHDH
ncbi:MAG: hypothetical protein HY906_11495 [Deltaproteobacteria bacterium]|nr:hypothetical protein [Deltaproteobacteria bacterium]